MDNANDVCAVVYLPVLLGDDFILSPSVEYVCLFPNIS